MKKVLSFSLVALISSGMNASAQTATGTITIQPKAGINIGTLTDESSSKARIGIAAGVEVSYQLASKFGLSTGVMYSQQGTKLDFDKLGWNHERGSYKLDYINVPVMANFYITKGLVLKAGLQYGYNINKKIDIKGITADIDEITDAESGKSISTRKNDLSIPMGVSYEKHGIVLDARYQLGITKIWKRFDDRNSVFQLTVGYKFKL